MDQKNKEGFGQEDTSERPISENIEETESVSEFISNMNFVHIKSFRPISAEDMMTKYKNDVFWYVFDETRQQVLAHPLKGEMEPVTYLFQEKEDAKTWRYIGSKSATHQDHKLSVEGAEFLSISETIQETLGEFKVMAISHAEAQNVFENYPEVQRTRKFEEEGDS